MKYIVGGILLGGALLLGNYFGATNQASQDYKQIESCKVDPSTTACLGISSEMHMVAFNTTFCKESLNTRSSAAQIVWHYKHCPNPTL